MRPKKAFNRFIWAARIFRAIVDKVSYAVLAERTSAPSLAEAVETPFSADIQWFFSARSSS